MDKPIRLNSLNMGVCYYPEHWPRALWESDLARMLDVGIEVIRIAEFAWSLFEPAEGLFTGAFFDEFLDLVEKTPMKVIFCTPTATPPAWLTAKYPEVLNRDFDGKMHRHGLRRHYNYNSEVYRDKSRQIVSFTARHYKDRPSIIGWQIDNELNCGTDEFYSDADHSAFRLFLKEKYGSLDRLNDDWGTVFWNQQYTDWEEVHLPRHNGRASSNPHQKLDSLRFFSWSALRYNKMQCEILRGYLPRHVYITTNAMFGHLDYDEMVDGALDFLMYDCYPAFGFAPERCDPKLYPLLDRKWSMNLARVRGFSPQFGVMEQQSGPGGWTTCNKTSTPKPGQARLWTFQSIAHGADFISYFRWRTCTFGTEIYWHGILDYDNRDNRRLAEIKRTRDDMRRVEDIAGAKYIAKLGIAYDFDNEWDGENDIWHGPLRTQSMANWFTAAQECHAPLDYVNVGWKGIDQKHLGQYDVIVYPHATIANERTAKLLTEYVKQGGTLLMGARSGYKDMRGQCPMTPVPGPFAELFGITVDDFTHLSPYDPPVTASYNGHPIEMATFNDVLTITAKSCAALATYDNMYYAGKPALTENKLGKGRAMYFGAGFSAAACKRFLIELGQAEAFGALVGAPPCVEIAAREKDGKRYLFCLNFMGESVRLDIKKPLTELLSGKTLEKGKAEMAAYDVFVLELS